MVIGMTGSATSANRQLYLVAGNTASLEIKEGEEEPHMPEGIEYEKKFVPEHPYCTNWPMTKKKIEQMELNFEDDQVVRKIWNIRN